LVEAPREKQREGFVHSKPLSLHGGVDPARRPRSPLESQQAVERADACFRALEGVQVEGELAPDLTHPARELRTTTGVEDRLALEDMLLADALLDLGHEEKRPTVGRRLLNEQEPAEGRETREEQAGPQREATPNA
jgi:hypothetical protein